MNARNPVLSFAALALLALASGCKSESGGGGGAGSATAPSKEPSAHVKKEHSARPKASESGAAASSSEAAAPTAAPVKDCGTLGAEVDDKVFAPFLPRLAGGYCADGAAIKTYGDAAKLDMDKLCTTAMDGGCVEYKDLGIKRFAQLQYKEGHGKGSWVEVRFSHFATAQGAYALFTKHVLAGDPAELTKPEGTKPFAAGGAASSGGGMVNVWKGEYVVELVFGSDDPSVQSSKVAFKKAAREATEPMAADIAAKLPGSSDPLPDVKLLPEADRYPLGVEYAVNDPLGMLKGAGSAATGFYHSGDKRWRVVAMVRPDSEKARSTMALVKKGGQAVTGIGEEAADVELTTNDKKKVDALFARSGTSVFGVVDDEYALDKKLSEDEKKEKLKALVSAAAPAPAPSGSAPKK